MSVRRVLMIIGTVLAFLFVSQNLDSVEVSLVLGRPVEAPLAAIVGVSFLAGLVVGAGCFAWQQWLIRKRDPEACFEGFQNNNYFGFAVFAGVLLEYTTR